MHFSGMLLVILSDDVMQKERSHSMSDLVQV